MHLKLNISILILSLLLLQTGTDDFRSRVIFKKQKVTKWALRSYQKHFNGKCLELEIKEVTVYAFSIENFKRSPEEVDTLMTLAREKFAKVMEEKDKLMEKGVKLQVIGNIKLLPEDLQKSIADAVILTKNNEKSVLNVAFAYTSRDEITNSIKTIAEGINEQDLEADDLNHSLIDQCLYTRQCRDVDLLVRTSGEMRFSDFLLWQTQSTVFYFTEALWPEFTLWHLLAAIFYYQRCYIRTKILKSYFQEKTPTISDNKRVVNFLSKVDKQRYQELVEIQKSRVV
ncbi:CLUMA_CG011064, isoform A [Clunio marinus]|uniref:Alkyl transferase n=1 Tax=Clunio marinus TaxID=568069 RepID=A0A1J1IDQ5_9DIPT|nr:CLUMA_CG011064, isoform A [Clunio marinus]